MKFVFLQLVMTGLVLMLPATQAFVKIPLSSLSSTRPASVTNTQSSSTALQGILNRLRKKKIDVPIPEPITVGSPIPEIDVEMLILAPEDDDGARVVTSEPVTATEVLGTTGKSILVGMPGAFTPVCSSEHLPGFIDKASQLKKLGIDKIAVVTTNDRFVNEEWGRTQGLFALQTNDPDNSDETNRTPIIMLSDGDAALVKELGMVEDMGFGVGLRSKRFALVLEDGLVTQVLIDEGMDSCEFTSATNLVNLLTPEEVAVEEQALLDVPPVAVLGACAIFLGFALVFSSGGGGTESTADYAAVNAAVPAVKSAAAPSGAASGTEFFLLKTFGQ